MTVPGLLIVISGPSGTGKGTICKALFQRRPDMFFSVSVTTRPPRAGETDGVNYHFRDRASFEKMLAGDEFLEWAQVYDNYYGTPRGPVAEALAAGRDVVLEIDIQGAMKVREKAPEGIFLFVVPPSFDILRSRIIGRATDAMEVIGKRLGKTLGELAHLHDYDYVIINDILEDAVDKVESIINAEKCRTGRYRLVSEAGPGDLLIVPK